MLRFCDETGFGFGWYDDRERLRRTSHALAVDGRVYVVDPAVGAAQAPVLERIRRLGEAAAVVQLLDRHDRDAAAVANALGVPHLRVPDALPPFDVLPVVRSRFWREVALWWPEGRVLVCADALGTLPYFCVGGERVGVHPLLRLRPPRALVGLDAAHVLVGHGDGVHEGAAAAVDEAVRHARRRIPRWLLGLPRRFGSR